MSTTELLKDELAGVQMGSRSARVSSVAAMLRFGGSFRSVPGALVVDVQTDSRPAATWLQGNIKSLYGHDSVVLPARGVPKGYLVRVARGGATLVRQAGLVSASGQLVRGLPAPTVGGPLQSATGLWHGAFLTQGRVVPRMQGAALEVRCPSLEAGLALAGAARRLGVRVRPLEQGGAVRMVVRSAGAVDAMLEALGAGGCREALTVRRVKQQARMPYHTAGFVNANASRSAFGAQRAVGRLMRAYEILGDSVPVNLKSAGDLRIAEPALSLEQLGHMADPVMTKDAIAGKLRRLLAVADARAAELGIPGTTASDSDD